MEILLNPLVLLANFILVPGLAYGSQLALGALGVTMVYAVLIIGMLVEFPHLTFLTRVFSGRNDRFIASTSEVLPSN